MPDQIYKPVHANDRKKKSINRIGAVSRDVLAVGLHLQFQVTQDKQKSIFYRLECSGVGDFGV